MVISLFMYLQSLGYSEYKQTFIDSKHRVNLLGKAGRKNEADRQIQHHNLISAFSVYPHQPISNAKCRRGRDWSTSIVRWAVQSGGFIV